MRLSPLSIETSLPEFATSLFRCECLLLGPLVLPLGAFVRERPLCAGGCCGGGGAPDNIGIELVLEVGVEVAEPCGACAVRRIRPVCTRCLLLGMAQACG